MRVMGDYADSVARLGRYREAVDLLMRSGSFYRRTQPAPNEAFANWLFSIGTAYSERALWRPAERAFAEAAATLGERFGRDDIQALGARGALAKVRAYLGDGAAARVELERLLAIQIRAQGADHPRTLTLRQQLGDVLLQLGDSAGAAMQATQALAAIERRYGSDSFRTLSALMLSARAQQASSRERDALAAAEHGVKIAETVLPRGDTKRIKARLLLSRMRSDRAATGADARIALDEIAAAPEQPLALEIEAHERLADAGDDASVTERERGVAKQLGETLAQAEQDELAAFERWLSTGPAYR